jgi:hypothetical protein
MEYFAGNAPDLERSLSTLDPKFMKEAKRLGQLIAASKDDANKQGQLYAEGMSKALERDPKNKDKPETSLEAAKKLNDAAIMAQEMAKAAGQPEQKSFFEKFKESMKQTAMQIAAGDAFLEIEKDDKPKSGQQVTPQQQRGKIHGEMKSISQGQIPEGYEGELGHKPRTLSDAVKIGVTKVAVALAAGAGAEREYEHGLKARFAAIDAASGNAPGLSAQMQNVSGKPLQTGTSQEPGMGENVDLEQTEIQKHPIKTAIKRAIKEIGDTLFGKDPPEKENGPASEVHITPEMRQQANASAAPPPPEALKAMAASFRIDGAINLGKEDPSHLGEEHASSTPSLRSAPRQREQDFDPNYYAKKNI